MEVKSPHRKEYREEDVITERVDHLIEHRIPWLFVGLLGGFLAALVVSKYEEILSLDVRLVFFIPVIVYMSSALGMQAETIYVRELSERKRMHFIRYILKESAIGLALGIIFGTLSAVFITYWLRSLAIGLTIGITMLVNLAIAPLLAVSIPRVLYQQHADPALGSGPVATIIQDIASLLIYFLVASAIIF